jgi:hypothetical protein
MGKGGVRRGGVARWVKPSKHALHGTLEHQVNLHRGKPGPGQYNVTQSATVGGGRFGSNMSKTGWAAANPSAWLRDDSCCHLLSRYADPAYRAEQAWT